MTYMDINGQVVEVEKKNGTKYVVFLKGKKEELQKEEFVKRYWRVD